METTPKPKMKPGPVKNPELVSTAVKVPRKQLDWAKSQPGGFADLVRDCLQSRYEAAQKPTA